ncbi:MAG: glycosyltransferase family 2 protein [Deltaproteobacteria bacterium]|nr:glycosyltransferase family 2 protein [Deltaproteobacteria bacterium]
MTHPAASEEDAPLVTVVVPCFNEEETLEPTLDELCGVLKEAPFTWEVLVVDDGSRDASAAITTRYADKEHRVGLLKHRTNQGSGQAIWTGIQAGRGKYVIYVPADGQFDHGEIPMYVAAAEEGADIVIGHRLSRDDYTLYRRASSFVFLQLCNSLFDHQFQDVNWVHLWRTEIFEWIEPKSRGVFFLEEILVRCRASGGRVVEVPSVYRPRQGGSAKGGRPSVIAKTVIEMLALWAERKQE